MWQIWGLSRMLMENVQVRNMAENYHLSRPTCNFQFPLINCNFTDRSQPRRLQKRVSVNADEPA